MKPTRIILHCSATREGDNISTDTIRDWHVRGNGWRDIGYHFIVLNDGKGTIDHGRSVSIPGAHVKGENHDSIGVCYIGGLDVDGNVKDTMTDIQQMKFIELVNALRMVFGDLPIYGHNEFSAKACPSFKVLEKFGPEICQRRS